jgi:hypothetical protein
MAGEWIPLQASIIRAETFFTVGGFNPLISGPEDIDLLRQIALQGDIAETDRLIACIARGESGSTTDYSRHAEIRRWSRERTLDSAGVLGRFRASAESSYLHGRILRVYLTSVVWNLQNRRPWTAASRAVSALAAFALAGGHPLSASYWRALTKAYENKTFSRGFREARSLAWADSWHRECPRQCTD